MKNFDLWVWLHSGVIVGLATSFVRALIRYYDAKANSYNADAENTRAQTAAKGDDGEGWKSNA